VGVFADFEGGYIKFPTGTDYETLQVANGILRISATTVNMKINGGSSNAGQYDQIVCVSGSISIVNGSVLNVTVNNVVVAGKTWPLLVSQLGMNDIAGDFTSVTPLNTFTDTIDNVGNETHWDLNS
jgi:hypothetical protein